MQLNLTPEDIETLVKDTILKSGVGKAIEQAVTKSLTGYNNPLDVAVSEAVKTMVSRILQEEPWNGMIRAAVIKAIETKVGAETLERISMAAVEKIERAARDY